MMVEVIMQIIITVSMIIKVFNKREISPYSDGILEFESFIDWIADVEKSIYYVEFPKGKKISLVACMLKILCFFMVEKFVNKKKP